jgi:hypothetical protein
MPGRQEIVTVGAPPAPGSEGERLQGRILELVGRGVPRLSSGPDGRLGYHGEWWHPPGALPWWETRQRAGGRVGAEVFRAAVEALVADGRLLEVWLEPDGQRAPGHLLLLPGYSGALRRSAVMARGRPDVLRGEPWAAGLGGGSPPRP